MVVAGGNPSKLALGATRVPVREINWRKGASAGSERLKSLNLGEDNEIFHRGRGSIMLVFPRPKINHARTPFG